MHGRCVLAVAGCVFLFAAATPAASVAAASTEDTLAAVAERTTAAASSPQAAASSASADSPAPPVSPPPPPARPLESLQIKLYVQPRYEAQLAGPDSGDNTFAVKRARVFFTSQVSPTLTGRVHFSVLPGKVDAKELWLRWEPRVRQAEVGLQVGSFKKPFSYQDFVERSSHLNLVDHTVATALVGQTLHFSGYDLGVMTTVDARRMGLPLRLDAGVFNGDGGGQRTDSDRGKEGVARLSAMPGKGLRLGANAAANRVGEGLAAATYWAWGGDLAWRGAGFDLVVEALGGDNYADICSCGDAASFLDAYVEILYHAPGGWEPGARVERFDPDTGTDGDRRMVWTGQVARSFSRNLRWQVNWVHVAFEDETREATDALVSQWTFRF